MMTTEQILEAIRQLPKLEKTRLSKELPHILAEDAPDRKNVKKGEILRSLAGCFDLGECLDPNPDREKIYQERFE